MQKAELRELVRRVLVQRGATVVDHTPAGQSEYFDSNIRHDTFPGKEIRARFFIWELTPDRSSQGRPPGEHKLQLTIGDRAKAVHNFPSTGQRQNFLLGYSQKSGLLVGFQAELHKNFGWSKLVAIRNDLLVRAKRVGWATHLRSTSRNTRQRELAIAFKPSHIVNWLRFQVQHPDIYGLARQSAADTWLAKEAAAANPVQAIAPATVPPATATDVVTNAEEIGVIAGDVQITAGAETVTVEVSIADRIAATNRHNGLLVTINNKIHDVFGDRAFVIDRDLPGHRQTYAGATLQPDLGARIIQKNVGTYIVVEAKSLPVDVGGQWRQVIIAIGELARYSMVYNERFSTWPTRVLALERLPDDPDLQRFLGDLCGNEDVCVIWSEAGNLQTFVSHHDEIPWLADAVE